MFVVATSSTDETRSVAASCAELSRAGDLIVLIGDLGAGKTAFVQGFGRALGVRDRITSPTFTLANVYEGDLTVNHLDAYRIGHIDEAIDLALPELLDAPSVTLIEWGDVVAPVLPKDYLELSLRFVDDAGDEERHIEIRAVGPRWRTRIPALESALSGRVLPC